MSFDRNRLPEPAGYYEAQGLRLIGPRSAKWKTTSCAFHGGADSMRVNMATGGFCCMNCGARGGDVLAYEMALNGSEFVEAARTLGAWIEDGKPQQQHKPAPLSPRAALEVLGFESTLVAVAAGNLAHGRALTDEDRARLLTCAGRINCITGYYA
jgi:CHC2 zinc finger